jgi:hypothetical protein
MIVDANFKLPKLQVLEYEDGMVLVPDNIGTLSTLQFLKSVTGWVAGDTQQAHSVGGAQCHHV